MENVEKSLKQMKIWEISIFTFIILNSCQGQSATEKKLDFGNFPTKSTTNKADTTGGIVYISYNNGLNWQNFSKGLPQKIQVGLGAIGVSENAIGLATKDSGIYLFDSIKNTWQSIPTDSVIIKSNIGSMFFFKERLLVGSQFGGIFSTNNQGKNWVNLNDGLANLTIRKFAEIDNKLFVGTNAGLFLFDEKTKKWNLEFNDKMLQVNGISATKENIYIATNKGAFTKLKNQSNWKHIFINKSLHNINSDENAIYAMVYNELFISTDKGKTWQSNQQGMPIDLYTFNVVKSDNSIFAGQWDGVYRKDNLSEKWTAFNNGLPDKFAITNMKTHKGRIIVSGNARKLHTGLRLEK